MLLNINELVYFDLTGRGEAIRILLSAAGVDFKDTRYTFAQWPEIKPTIPLGQLPVLKIDGKDYVQSIALTRYAGKLAGWYPSDPLAALKCDEAAETMSEMMAKIPHAKDPEELKKEREEFQAGLMTKALSLIESRIQESGGPFVSGPSPSYADVLILVFVKFLKTGFFDHIDPKVFDKFPSVSAMAIALDENEQVKAYYASVKKD